jgi:hypothetical protein
MKREDFVNVAEEALDSLQQNSAPASRMLRFLSRIFRPTRTHRNGSSKGGCF